MFKAKKKKNSPPKKIVYFILLNILYNVSYNFKFLSSNFFFSISHLCSGKMKYYIGKVPSARPITHTCCGHVTVFKNVFYFNFCCRLFLCPPFCFAHVCGYVCFVHLGGRAQTIADTIFLSLPTLLCTCTCTFSMSLQDLQYCSIPMSKTDNKTTLETILCMIYSSIHTVHTAQQVDFREGGIQSIC